MYEVLSLLDDIDSSLQGGLLLLAKTLDQVLHRFHRFCIHIIQQLLLKLLQPCPQLTVIDRTCEPVKMQHTPQSEQKRAGTKPNSAVVNNRHTLEEGGADTQAAV